MTIHKVLVVNESEERAETDALLFIPIGCEPILCTDLEKLFPLLESESPSIIFWVHGPGNTSVEIRYLEKVRQVYRTDSKPKIILAIANRGVYPELEVLADLIVDQVILDWGKFRQQVEGLLEKP